MNFKLVHSKWKNKGTTGKRCQIKHQIKGHKSLKGVTQHLCHETAKVIDDLRAASDTFVGEKKEVKKYSKLGDPEELIEKTLVATNDKIEELNALMKAKTEMFESVLSMLQNSVTQLSTENLIKGEAEGVKVNDCSGVNEEMEPIVAKLEAMKSVFREREEKVGEIQQQMESLQIEVKKKRKCFWTLVSSATTVSDIR